MKAITYDLNGNMTTLKRYNSSSSVTENLAYSYDGTKAGVVSGGSGRAYLGSMVFDLSVGSAASGAPDSGNVTLTFESAAGVCGRIVKSGGSTVPNYEINDYLGSVRVVTGPTGSVLARHDYYATGARMNTGNTGTGRGRFIGKEAQDVGSLDWLDFGARMYDPSIARWTVQDPLAEKYLSWSPYVYCVGDPVNYFDNGGLDLVLVGANNSSVTFKTDLIDRSFDISRLGVDWKGNHTLDGAETLGAALDLAGFFDPTGIADGTNAVLQATEGNYWGALQSGLSTLPLGDVVKVGRIGKDVRIIGDAVGSVSHTTLHRPYIRKWVRDAVESKAGKSVDGRFLDVNTGEPVDGKYDLGHVFGKEYKTMKADAESRGMTQKEFNDYMNNPDYYQIEDKHNNRSHKYEKKQ